MNLDLNNSKILTILVIIVIILFAIIYICIIWNVYEKEEFVNYPVAVDDIIQLQGGLNNVKLGSNNIPLTIYIDDIIQQSLNNAVPPLTIVSYFGTTAPTGWQICDGTSLIAMDNKKVYNKNGNSINTPNLQGRVIVGSNISSSAIKDINNNVLSIYNVGDYGGEENHTLLINEIPPHAHGSGAYTYYSVGGTSGGLRFNDYFNTGTFRGAVAGGNAQGNTDSHYNMQPYYVLTYIIKKPLFGGSDIPL